MPRAQELLTRWPALDVPARQHRLRSTWRVVRGPLEQAIDGRRAAASRAAAGLWSHDPATWSADAAVQAAIANRLGWLTSPASMADQIHRLQTFAASVRDRFSDVLLLGMGGSSLAPEVLRAVLGVAPGWPRLHVLDSTDPDAIRALTTPPAQTLYLFSSKSGTTIEPNTLAAYFRGLLGDAGVSRWADHFVAITDEGTPLAARARADSFRELFVNPGDIGARYSALSYFGLVPAALMGQNLPAIVAWALAMLAAAESDEGGADPLANPAVGLGLTMGAAARAGRDKLTLVLPPSLEPFGLWVEQLVAESTGKHGTGIVPIAGETLGPVPVYRNDRLFVRVRLHGSVAEDMRDPDVRALERANAPVGEIDLLEPAALGAEFVRWEIATAVAGALLEINPFDEPNVQQAKDATNRLLADFTSRGRLPAPAPDRALDRATLTLSSAARTAIGRPTPEAILTLLKPGDYFALLAYLSHDDRLYEELRTLRMTVRDRTGAATMFGYGPRYLHSTGQLHKGGPNTGVFVLVSTAPRVDLDVPHQAFSFGTLELAQALGDFSSLDAAGRRALHVHLAAPDPGLLHEIAAALTERLTFSA